LLNPVKELLATLSFDVRDELKFTFI
jgi:hypothetical protein